MRSKLKAIYSQIRKFEAIYIARHIGPDPDAICSQIALRDSIKLTFPNKKVYAIGASVSKFKIFGKLDKPERFDYEKDLVITLDVPDIGRIDGVDVTKFKNVIKIDHHPFVEKFSDLECIDEKASSTCEVVYKLIRETKLKCDKQIAENLFIGIISDSNRFMFNPSHRVFYEVGDLTNNYKFDIEDAYKKIYLRPISEVRLMGYIAANLKLTKNGFAFIEIEEDIIKSFGADISSASNMVGEFNNINEILAWTFITWDAINEQFRVNIRSRGPIVNEVASNYNGGGHKYASGARVKTREELNNLIYDLDELCRNFKE